MMLFGSKLDLIVVKGYGRDYGESHGRVLVVHCCMVIDDYVKRYDFHVNMMLVESKRGCCCG